MKKKYFILVALIIGMMAGASSCKKKTIDPTPSSGGGVVEKEPTEDLVTVKTKVETIVYGDQALNYYATALLSRLMNVASTFNDSTTKAVVIFNSAVPSLAPQDYTNIYRCYKNGGNVVIISPTDVNFAQVFREGILTAAFNEDVEKYNTVGVDREQWMEYVGNKLFTLASNVTPSTDGVLAVSVGFHNKHKYILNKILETTDLSSITNYQYGLMADGVVQWINDTQIIDRFTFKAITEGGTLNDPSKSEMQTCEYPVVVVGEDNYSDGRYYSGVVQNIIAAYASYSFNQNADWYQVDQSISFRNGKISPVGDVNDHKGWWWTSADVPKKFIKSLYAFQSKMWLTIPQGNVIIHESHPNTENGSMSSSYETSQGKTVNRHEGGFSIGFGGRGFADFSLDFSRSMSLENSFSTTVGTSCTINDLSVTKSTVNESGCNKVKWDYNFRAPYGYEGTSKGSSEPTYYCWWAAPLAITDCDQKNSILFYVENPSGQAVVNCYNWWQYDFSWENQGEGTSMKHDLNAGDATAYLTLKQPNRYKEEWGISCVGYGDIQGNLALMTMFENRITADIIGGESNRFNYVGGADQYDNTEANNLLNCFIDDFANMSESYALQGYTGTFTFKLKAKHTEREISKSYTINPAK